MMAQQISHGLAANIRAERARRAWSQRELASMAGISVRTLQAAERGQTIKASTLEGLARALRVSVRSLIPEQNPQGAAHERS